MNNNNTHVPPGFRFHPTDEELVDYYLRNKINSSTIDLDVIKHVDLYKIEPWDLQELCRVGTEEQNEWYLFSHKDKKYPTGTRTNRATSAGFWKATGRDKAIYSKHELMIIGMRKTLVFYKGRAPNGLKSDWIMHEYRLEAQENGTSQEEGWVVCRVFKKRVTTNDNMRQHSDWYDNNNNDQHYFMQQQQQHDHYFDSSSNSSTSSSSKQITHHSNHNLAYQQQFPLLIHHLPQQLPILDINPTKLLIQQSPSYSTNNHPIMAPFGIIGSENHATPSPILIAQQEQIHQHQVAVGDWIDLDNKFASSSTSSKLIISTSQEEEASMMIRRSSGSSNAAKDNWDNKQQQEETMMMMPQNNNHAASTCSNSRCPMDM